VSQVCQQYAPGLHEKEVHGGFPPDAYSIIYANLYWHTFMNTDNMTVMEY